MKIQYMSDLHLEFGGIKNFKKFEVIGDVILIAGDTDSNMKLIEPFIHSHIPNTPVVITLGNHEFYTGIPYNNDTITNFKNHLASTFRGRVHLLEQETIKIDGIKFVGCVGWTDGSHMKWWPWMNYINDLTYIKGFKEANGGQDWGKQSYKFLMKEVDNKSVVITHNSPLLNSCREEWKISPINVFFSNNWEKLIMDKNPLLWVHGHTHDSYNYTLPNGTQIVCNPRGYYPNNINIEFNPNNTVNL